jgi:FkbM family methyltransferase
LSLDGITCRVHEPSSIVVRKLDHIRGQLNTLGVVLQHFRNPLLIILLRLGLVRLPVFLYRIAIGGRKYSMLARPATTSMADLFVLKELLVQENYSPILAHLPDEPLRFVDVGGNIGAFGVWLASRRRVREGFVFEPLRENQRLLEFNLAENGLSSVRLVRAALGGAARTERMALNTSSPGGSSLYDLGRSAEQERQTVGVLAFKSWMDQQAGEFHLLKMDCEGAEWEILEGTPTDYFRRFAVIVAEVHARPDSPDVSPFKAYFDRAGFRTVRWDGASHGVYVGVREG